MQEHDDPPFQIVLLFHKDIDLFRLTAPRCVTALTGNTQEQFELTIYCDGTPIDLIKDVHSLGHEIEADTVIHRHRERFVATGAPGNNAHRRLFPTRSRYLIVIEDDVTMYRTSQDFDVLRSTRLLFDEHPQAVVLTKLDDHDKWAWKLSDIEPERSGAVRYVNRVATHFICYHTERFTQAATRFGAWWSDVFIDRPDWSYNWEDLVSHIATTGKRRIAFPHQWPLFAYHCDEKIAPGSMYNTQDLEVKRRVFDSVDARYSHRAAGPAKGRGYDKAD